MTENTYEIGGGRTVADGKADWPDCLHLAMNRSDAWEMVQSIINQLRDDNQNKIRYSSCGKLENEPK